MVKKPVLIPVSYDESDNDEEVEMVLTNNQNNCNYYNIVSNSKIMTKPRKFF